MTIQEFAQVVDVGITILFRSPTLRSQENVGNDAWYAKLDHCMVDEGDVLSGAFGNGSTPDEALSDYCRRISGKRVVFDSMGRGRKYDVPQLDAGLDT